MEKTLLVLSDDDEFITVNDKGALIHTSLRHATLYIDDGLNVIYLDNLKRMLPKGKVFRLHLHLEEIE